MNDLIEAAVRLDKPEQSLLIAAIVGPNGWPAGSSQQPWIREDASEWAVLACEGLTRAYGDDEPEYSEADLVP